MEDAAHQPSLRALANLTGLNHERTLEGTLGYLTAFQVS